MAIKQFLLLFQDAVGRYDEVVHNLKFSKDLEKTLCSLTQDVRTGLHLGLDLQLNVLSINVFLLVVEGSEEGHTVRADSEGRDRAEAFEYDAAGAVCPLQSPEA